MLHTASANFLEIFIFCATFQKDYTFYRVKGADKMKDEFELLVEKYADTVTRICFVNLENRADAEDAWQNVFLKLFKAKHIWQKPDEEIRKWLVTVTLNECRDIKRKLFRRNHDDIEDLQASYTEDFKK